ncbi:unnamed protein product [Durusdinium trenchii]|uniref:PDZ domain-containing protein n=1 Tax=Durusdinium trenchii TaxID=1381693 RepID=A0ABP0J6C3_9DINO
MPFPRYADFEVPTTLTSHVCLNRAIIDVNFEDVTVDQNDFILKSSYVLQRHTDRWLYSHDIIENRCWRWPRTRHSRRIDAWDPDNGFRTDAILKVQGIICKGDISSWGVPCMLADVSQAVSIHKSEPNDQLGMDVKHRLGRLVVLAIRRHGAVDRANAVARQQGLAAIQVNDVIVEVNGATLDTGMVAQCKSAVLLNVTFIRREHG